MVSDDKDSEKVKLTKVLEFVPARKPEQAKLGEVVCFMHNLGNGLSAYWMQGTLDKRLDKYSVAKESKFTRNRFRVNKLSIVNHWGEKGTIPETLTVVEFHKIHYDSTNNTSANLTFVRNIFASLILSR